MYISGTITYFNSQRGFGFITLPSGQQYFFHVSNFAKGQYPVLEGRVEFQIARPIAVGKRPQAANVRYIKQSCVTASPDEAMQQAAKLVDAAQEGGMGGGN